VSDAGWTRAGKGQRPGPADAAECFQSALFQGPDRTHRWRQESQIHRLRRSRADGTGQALAVLRCSRGAKKTRHAAASAAVFPIVTRSKLTAESPASAENRSPMTVLLHTMLFVKPFGIIKLNKICACGI